MMFKLDLMRECEFEVSALNDCIQNLNKEITLKDILSSEEIKELVNLNVNLNKSNKIIIYTEIDEPSRLAVYFKWNISFNKNIKEPAIENILALLKSKNVNIRENDLGVSQRTIKIDYEIFNIMMEI